MSAVEQAATYTPQDTLYLWWLADPQSPDLIGDLRLADGNRRVSLTYCETWLQRGFALSEDLPLTPNVHVPQTKGRAAGAVDDARPDRWGERIIQLIDRPSRLSLLEYLYFAGDDRIGALGVSVSRDSYQPKRTGPMPEFQNLEVMAKVVRQVLANEPVAEHHRRLLRPGASLGGARPKSLITLKGEPWIVKFAEGDGLDSPMLEHATMQMARLCGIHTADTQALTLNSLSGHSHAVAVRRFDREGQNRLHVLSAHVALVAAGEEMGYPELAQLLRRLGEPEHIARQQQELFRRMVFNILIDNTDDHEKNHALIRQVNGKYALSPAYDVLPTMQGLRLQQMRVGEYGSESTVVNALSECQQFGLKVNQAKAIVKEISDVVSQWRAYFGALGVGLETLDQVSRFVDGEFLREQRF
jgi:serine/threonine-protein kinase HipA